MEATIADWYWKGARAVNRASAHKFFIFWTATIFVLFHITALPALARNAGGSRIALPFHLNWNNSTSDAIAAVQKNGFRKAMIGDFSLIRGNNRIELCYYEGPLEGQDCFAFMQFKDDRLDIIRLTFSGLSEGEAARMTDYFQMYLPQNIILPSYYPDQIDVDFLYRWFLKEEDFHTAITLTRENGVVSLAFLKIEKP